MAETGAFVGYPNLTRQAAKLRQAAAGRDVNSLPDPRTYAFVSGLLGEAPGEQGFSVLHPDASGIRKAADAGYVGGLLAMAAPATKGVKPVAQALAPKAADMAENYLVRTGLAAPIFIGKSSKTWDANAAARAAEMEAAGADARAIWSETGTLRGPDGAWRQEISDHNSRPLAPGWGSSEDLKRGSPGLERRQKALAHPALSAAYPETKNIAVTLRPGAAENGSYIEGADGWPARVVTNAPPSGGFKADRSTMLHELQHAVQGYEKFARGGAPEDMRPAVFAPEFVQQMDAAKQAGPEGFQSFNKARKAGAYDAYRRLAGEAEARAVQTRANMTPAERRAVFPFDSYDVPPEGLIVDFGGVSPAARRSLLD